MNVASERQLEGKRALVTGAASGIGRGIARRFAAEGAVVAVVDCEDDGARETARQITDDGGHAIVVPCDVSDTDQIIRAVDAVTVEFGGLDIAVANAAIMDRTPLLDTTPEIFDRIISVNLRGAYFVTVAAARIMGAAGGVIIQVTSVEDDRGVLTSGAPYTVSKGGQRALVAAAAVQLGEQKIRVVGLAPGMVPSGLNGHNPRGSVSSIPMGRLGTVDDMANAAAFLASDRAAYVNGSTLYVDGGWLGTLV